MRLCLNPDECHLQVQHYTSNDNQDIAMTTRPSFQTEPTIDIIQTQLYRQNIGIRNKLDTDTHSPSHVITRTHIY